LKIDQSPLKPGMRIAVGLSGGADSVALLRALHERAGELGLVLSAAHLHHGLRGAEADGDLEFCRELAATLGVEFHEGRVDPASKANAGGETIEEAARRLRYSWFRKLMSKGLPHAVVPLDAVATAHTRDDQAETVLAKFLRGAWTEGLSGIYPLVHFDEGNVVRPLLGTTRAEIEAYLHELGQDWREDSSNRQTAFTRNRIRHELLPVLESWNPKLREHLAGMAALARDEEAWWEAEVAMIATQLLMPGRPVRGGGRAAGTGASLAIDVTRLAMLPVAMQRRLLRHAAAQLGGAPDFAATEALRLLGLTGRAGQRLELANGLRVERTARELRLGFEPATGAREPAPEYTAPVPGEILAEAFGIRLRIDAAEPLEKLAVQERTAVLRNWRPGDRVRQRYSGAPRKVKEVLERLKVTGSNRPLWPVLEFEGRIVWMQDVELEPELGVRVYAEALSEPSGPDWRNGT
jgi:tRNA(Ile)-lysidine synthase